MMRMPLLFSSKKSFLQRQLAQSWRYKQQLQKLQIKNEPRGGLYRVKQEDVPLGAMLMDLDRFSRIMARTVSEGAYCLEPARSRVITVNGKQRELFAFRVTDLVVHGVVAELILEQMRSRFSPHLFSYLKGTNWWRGISSFAIYIRKHRTMHPDPRCRGVYVLRRDIKKYTDTIPVGDTSPVWAQLREVLRVSEADHAVWRMIKDVVRPEVLPESGKGGLFSKFLGVPTGSPISTTLFNTYLHEVDEALDGIEGAFYARYADDLIFAHPDPHVVREAEKALDLHLKRLCLRVNMEKGQDLFFNGAGRKSMMPGWRSACAVRFLGCQISFEGTVSLTAAKALDLLRDIEDRTRTIVWSEEADKLDVRTELVCAMINQTLDPSEGRPHKTAALLRHAITDRKQLLNLDYRIALLAAEIISGQSGPRAFRKVAYEKLRSRGKLTSLYHERNRGGKPRSSS